MNPGEISSSVREVFCYKAFGLLIHSNLPVAGLVTASPYLQSSLGIILGSLPNRDSSQPKERVRFTSSYLNDAGQPILRIWDVDDGAFLRMVYPDSTEFWLNRDLDTLWAHWPESLSLENTLTYLLGPVLGLLLRLRGVVCLHASVVAIDDHAVIFVGHEGAGKSTTAAAFAKQGFAVLSDDIAALVEQDGRFHILPAYPRVNLWPDAVDKIYGSPEALPPITSDWDKRGLALGQEPSARFEERTLPVGAIYIFGDPAAASEKCVEPIPQKSALLKLVTNTYATNFLDARQRAEEFEVLSRLVTSVPIRNVNPHRGVLRVEELCDLIRKDFAGMRASE